MILFVLYLHPFLVRMERICGDNLCVAYADDVTVISESTQQIDQMRELFTLFERAAGAKLNVNKTLSINVGWGDESSLIVPWLQTQQQVKILGVIFTNSFKEMIRLNWDRLINKFAHQVWLHSRRTLTVVQKVILLNTFITSKLWYVASIVPPLNLHTAKITATIGRFIWRNLPARIPIVQLARSKVEGGQSLHLPAFKCKALVINRYIKELDSMPFIQSLITGDITPPSNFPCVKFIHQHYSLLPPHLKVHPSSKALNSFFVNRTERPRMERKHGNANWRRIWKNISNKSISSDARSTLYMFVNEKTEHNQLLNTIQRVSSPSCTHCGCSLETLKHKFSTCSRVADAWNHVQLRIQAILGRRRTISFEELSRPELNNVPCSNRNKILTILAAYIAFVNEQCDGINVNELAFNLDVLLNGM